MALIAGIMETEFCRPLAQVLKTLVALAVLMAVGPLPCPAQASSTSAPSGSGIFSAIQNYFLDWFPRVTRIQSEQPHWVTPIVTVTPRLEEEFRYDQFWQANPYGQATDNFGGGKG
jgi:hypothetical protein